MLILTKAVISLMLGFIVAILLGFIIVPYMKKLKASQSVSKHLNERHLAKEGTPTMGGFIFVGAVTFLFGFFFLTGKTSWNASIIILFIIFLSYATIGFLDDYKKIKQRNNGGLSILSKFLFEIIIAVIFFALYILSGNNTNIQLFNFVIDLRFLYGFLILLMLTGTSNAVNITDGLDGLCVGLCAISFLTYGIIAFNSNFIMGYEEIGVFCFVLSGALLGFLFFNFYPAKIFMGDLGSLALGASLATVAILLKKEVSLIIIGLVYILETISSFIQIVGIKLFNKKIFLKSPLHHHFEELGFCESDIIKFFYTIGLIFSLITLIGYVWM